MDDFFRLQVPHGIEQDYIQRLHLNFFHDRDLHFVSKGESGDSIIQVSSVLWKMHSTFVNAIYERWDGTKRQLIHTHFPHQTVNFANELLLNFSIENCSLEVVHDLILFFDYYDVSLGKEFLEKSFEKSIAENNNNIDIFLCHHLFSSIRDHPTTNIRKAVQHEAFLRLTRTLMPDTSCVSPRRRDRLLRSAKRLVQEFKPFSFDDNDRLKNEIVLTDFNQVIVTDLFQNGILPHTTTFCLEFIDAQLAAYGNTENTENTRKPKITKVNIEVLISFLTHVLRLHSHLVTMQLVWKLSLFASKIIIQERFCQSFLVTLRSLFQDLFSMTHIMKFLSDDFFLQNLPREAEETLKFLLFTFDIKTTSFMYQHASPILYSMNRIECSASILGASLMMYKIPNAYNSECVRHYIHGRFHFHLQIGKCILAALSEYSNDPIFDEIKIKLKSKTRKRALESLE